MSANAELLAALGMFNKSVQEASTSYAVNEASKVVSQIKSSAIDDAQKRQALEGLGNSLALNLAGMGASGTQIATAFDAVRPKQFGSAEQLQIEAGLTGNKQQQKVADSLIQQRIGEQRKTLEMKYGFEEAIADKKFQRELALEGMKLAKKAPDIKPEDVAFQTNISVANKMIDDLEATIKDKGTFETGFGTAASKKASAKLDAIPYQLAITYAKIVDPNSVAREGEVAAAQKYLLNLGAFSNQDKAFEALTNMRETIKSYSESRATAQGKSPAAAAGMAPNVTVRQLPDGTRIKVRKTPDGQWEEVP